MSNPLRGKLQPQVTTLVIIVIRSTTNFRKKIKIQTIQRVTSLFWRELFSSPKKRSKYYELWQRNYQNLPKQINLECLSKWYTIRIWLIDSSIFYHTPAAPYWVTEFYKNGSTVILFLFEYVIKSSIFKNSPLILFSYIQGSSSENLS